MPQSRRERGRDTVALVLSGGGARGAYEIGVLSALLPALPQEEQPNLVIGTSVGALNAAYIAAHAHDGLDATLRDGKRIWEEIDWGQILTAPWSASQFERLGRYLLGVAGVRGMRVPSVLDSAPLESTVKELIPDFDQIERNIPEKLAAAAVVATSALTSRSVVFHHGGEPEQPRDPKRGIDYVRVALKDQHVRASAAIPVAFPPVHVDPNPGRGWVLRRRHPAQHADQASAAARRPAGDRHRPQLNRPGAGRGRRRGGARRLRGATQLIQAVTQ